MAYILYLYMQKIETLLAEDEKVNRKKKRKKEMSVTLNKAKIFRYKLTDEIMALITQFAKIHQFDDRHTYKEAWTHWLEIHRDFTEREVNRLHQLGYKGDVEDKMFKAGRYYFREKVQVAVAAAVPVSAATAKKNTTRDYIVMAPEVIQAMDAHLAVIIKNKDFKPAAAYTQFCEQHIELLRIEIRRLLGENKTKENADKMVAKLKKTYKNRYFILTKVEIMQC